MVKSYPDLQKIQRVKICNFPTDVHRLKSIGKFIGCDNLWIKRDDKTSSIYGGNKPRKLEFIIADALNKNSKRIITIGGWGSNHCLATTLHSQKFNIKTSLILVPQPITEHVKKNLLLNNYFGADIHPVNSRIYVILKGISILISSKLKGENPYYLQPGGSSTLGSIGYVQGAGELNQQIENNKMPRPDYIFIPTGSCGTHAGLQVGLKLCGLETKLIGIRVVEKFFTNKNVLKNLANKIIKYLKEFDNNIPHVKFTRDDFILLDDYIGDGYGAVTEKGLQAIKLMKEYEGIELDITYTGKTFSALVDFIKQENVKDKTILFWNTFNSVDLSDIYKNLDYKKLPKNLHKIYE